MHSTTMRSSHVGSAIPKRGDIVPWISGRSADSHDVSTRDFYMRRNLAIIFVDASDVGRQWVADAANVRDAATAEAGEILVVGPISLARFGLPTIDDSDGSLALRFGLDASDLPAVFVIDRYGRLFATNRGESAEAELGPSAIPGWLEFIACRCS